MRIAKVQVSNELIIQMLCKGWNTQFTECVEGLPEGAEFVYSIPDENGRDAVFVMMHRSFADIERNQEVPYIRVIFKRYFYPEVEALLTRLKADQPT